jgi:hypothetical protein
MGWDGMGWDGMGWDGMGWDGNQVGGLYILMWSGRVGQGVGSGVEDSSIVRQCSVVYITLYYNYTV